MMLKSERALILGGAGFIGSHIAAEFVKMGAQVKIVDGFLPNTGANIENIRPIIEDVEVYNKKVEGLENLADLIDACDLIVDSMGLTSHSFGMEHPLMDLNLNLTSHIHVIKALNNFTEKKVIYLGSRAQYGKGREPAINENSPQEPVDTQGTFKAAAENLYRIYAKAYGFKVISLRVTNCFGENQKTQGPDIGLVGLFIRDILSGNPVEVYSDSKRKKNIIYVKDLAKIIAYISELELDTFEAFNVAGIELSLEKLLKSIIRIAGTGEYCLREFPESIKCMDVGEAKFDDSKLTAQVGRQDFTELDVTLENTVTYFKNVPLGAGSHDI
jgi:nucleoside-diphosphate-sugar epimerase